MDNYPPTRKRRTKISKISITLSPPAGGSAVALQPPSLFQDVELPDVVSRCTEWNSSGFDGFRSVDWSSFEVVSHGCRDKESRQETANIQSCEMHLPTP